MKFKYEETSENDEPIAMLHKNGSLIVKGTSGKFVVLDECGNIFGFDFSESWKAWRPGGSIDHLIQKYFYEGDEVTIQF